MLLLVTHIRTQVEKFLASKCSRKEMNVEIAVSLTEGRQEPGYLLQNIAMLPRILKTCRLQSVSPVSTIKIGPTLTRPLGGNILLIKLINNIKH